VTVAVRDRGAEHLVVELQGGRRVVLRVTHDGGAGPGHPGTGVRALQEQVELLGATFRELRSAPGTTTIEVELAPERRRGG
jgi:glucose-6-phosphate-specific signal transduction histidine kinase